MNMQEDRVCVCVRACVQKKKDWKEGNTQSYNTWGAWVGSVS